MQDRALKVHDTDNEIEQKEREPQCNTGDVCYLIFTSRKDDTNLHAAQ